MSIEFLLVTFPEERAVLADGKRVGFTNHTLMLPTGEYLITLDGGGYRPASRDIALTGTSIPKPMVIAFAPVSAAGGAPRTRRKKAGDG
ncbi:MAG TPA: PEGA domain-containing protein [Burkholderiales bacterium]|nr:PEGA domain-containing protein [Burkholderiales bacterium]